MLLRVLSFEMENYFWIPAELGLFSIIRIDLKLVSSCSTGFYLITLDLIRQTFLKSEFFTHNSSIQTRPPVHLFIKGGKLRQKF